MFLFQFNFIKIYTYLPETKISETLLATCTKVIPRLEDLLELVFLTCITNKTLKLATFSRI